MFERLEMMVDDLSSIKHIRPIIGAHHERWDGTGYPYGLKGTAIPLHGRIMAIVDVYDALVSGSRSRKALKEEEAIRIILDNAGKHFDPTIAEVFF
jgi:putative two-component system response regulator